MEWTYLLLAAAFEISWAVAMKYAAGFTKLVPSLITAAGYILSAVFLALALRRV